MKKTYHICLSSGDEVYCRDEEDYNYCFNSLALAIDETDSVLLADSIMSTHIHECVRSSDPQKLLTRQRYRYAKYFSAKYGRRGRFGERVPFMIEVQGIYHLLAALSYVLRNALHHGVAPTPFAYPFSTVNTLFRKDLGKVHKCELLSARQCHRYLPDHRSCPSGYRMGSDGLILMEDVVDTADVEHLFGSARAFLYYMNRLSGEEWQREQAKDASGKSPIITLDLIEKGVRGQSVEQMLRHEHGRSRYDRMGDLEVCRLIDRDILPSIGKDSVYQLTQTEKLHLAREICNDFKLSQDLVKRCLAII